MLELDQKFNDTSSSVIHLFEDKNRELEGAYDLKSKSLKEALETITDQTESEMKEKSQKLIVLTMIYIIL